MSLPLKVVQDSEVPTCKNNSNIELREMPSASSEYVYMWLCSESGCELSPMLVP